MPQITVKTVLGETFEGDFVRFSTPPGSGETEVGIRISEAHTVYVPLPNVDELNVEGTFKNPVPRELEEYFQKQPDGDDIMLFNNAWEVSTTTLGPTRFENPADAMNAIADELEGLQSGRWKVPRKVRLDEAEAMMRIAQRQGFIKTKKVRIACI